MFLSILLLLIRLPFLLFFFPYFCPLFFSIFPSFCFISWAHKLYAICLFAVLCHPIYINNLLDANKTQKTFPDIYRRCNSRLVGGLCVLFLYIQSSLRDRRANIRAPKSIIIQFEPSVRQSARVRSV